MTTSNNNSGPPSPDEAQGAIDGDDAMVSMSQAELGRMMASARRTGEGRASRREGAPPAAPNASRIDRVEASLERLIGVLTPQAAPTSGQAAPAAAPAVRYESFAAPGGQTRTVAVQPATAPSAPAPHTLPTNSGLVDIWNLNPGQIDQLGPAGIRVEFEKHKEVADRLSGRPQKPLPPFIVNPDGSRSAPRR